MTHADTDMTTLSFHSIFFHSFIQFRVVSVWNSLPDTVVCAESVNSFKSRLDKFWSMHDFVYDYRAGPLAAGSQVSL